jgi:hypothetical protein
MSRPRAATSVATSTDVRAVGEHGQHLIAVALFQIAMQADRRNAFGGQVVDGFLNLLLGEAEGHARLRAEMATAPWSRRSMRSSGEIS